MAMSGMFWVAGNDCVDVGLRRLFMANERCIGRTVPRCRVLLSPSRIILADPCILSLRWKIGKT